MTVAEKLRAAIRARLEQLDLSINQAERDADLGKGTISKFLNGDTETLSLAVVERIAPALKATLADLIGTGAGAMARSLHPDQITKSPLNPRKTTALDKGPISDLARSIAEKGVLQPIIVRPIDAARWAELTGAELAPGTEAFEIAAGERRWRGSVYAIENALVAPDFTMPVIVRTLTDDELVEVAVVENVERADMSSLEEADALAFLHERARARGEHKDFTQRIAAACGKTDRWVQKRVRMSRDLIEAARAKLADGDISLQQALELSEVPAAAQTHALDKIAKGDSRYKNAEQLHAALLQDLPEEAEAVFDLAAYDGGVIVRDKVRYLADAKQAERLQKAAIKARIADLTLTHAFVEEASSYYWESEYPEAPKSLKDGKGERKPWGVVVHRAGFAVTFHDRRLKRPNRDAAADAGGPDGEAILISQRDAARAGVRRKLAEQLGLLFEARPLDAARILILEAIDHDGTLMSGAATFDNVSCDAALALLGVTLPQSPGFDHGEKARLDWEKAALAAIVAGLKAADERTLWRCIALMADPVRDRHACEEPLTPTDLAMLSLLDLEVPPPLQHEIDGGDILDLASPPEPEPETDEGDQGDESDEAEDDDAEPADADDAAGEDDGGETLVDPVEEEGVEA